MKKNRFQKQFIPKATLLNIYDSIAPKISSLKEDYDNYTLTPAEFCAGYILTFYKTLYKNKWKMGPLEITCETNNDDLKTICNYNIRSLPYIVRQTLAMWNSSSYPLQLLFNVPSAQEILTMQSQGVRCATAVLGKDLKNYVVQERDPLSFLIHDLIHAYHFWNHPENAKAQTLIYDWFLKLTKENVLDEPLKDEHFYKGFEYISSDMNTHPVHLLKTFKFHIDDYFTRNSLTLADKENFLEKILNVKTKKGKFVSEFSLLNTSGENPEVINQIQLFLV